MLEEAAVKEPGMLFKFHGCPHINQKNLRSYTLFMECFNWILPFFSPHTDCTIFRYSPQQLFDTRTNSTFFRYEPGFYNFSVHTLIEPFSGTRPNYFSILARILAFPGTRPDSTIFRSSHWLDSFPVLARKVFRYSDGFLLFEVLARILPFSQSSHWLLPFPVLAPSAFR